MLEERIDRLERRLRRYRNLLSILAVLLIAAVAWGQTRAVPDVLEARKFVVLDRDTGAPIAILGQRASGGSLDIMNSDANRVIHLEVGDTGKGRLLLCEPGGAMSRECTTLSAP